MPPHESRLAGPPLEVYLAFRGAHAHQLWERVGLDWSCPSCRRTKYQLMCWTTRFPNSPKAFMDWIAVLHQHHDHAGDQFPGQAPRFPATVICHQCNVADGQAKRKLGLPANFSFSPSEIAAFIVAAPHAPHRYEFEVARRLFDAATSSGPRR